MKRSEVCACIYRKSRISLLMPPKLRLDSMLYYRDDVQLSLSYATTVYNICGHHCCLRLFMRSCLITCFLHEIVAVECLRYVDLSFQDGELEFHSPFKLHCCNQDTFSTGTKHAESRFQIPRFNNYSFARCGETVALVRQRHNLFLVACLM